ncbi:Transporter of the ATP-binding cassette (ABC), partial [Coemansia spiralis]
MFAGPFFLQRIIRAIEQAGGADANLRSAYLDAFGLLLFTVGQSLMDGQSLWIGRCISVRLKGLLVAELSAKTLRRRGKGAWEDKDPDSDSDSDDESSDGEPAAEAAADGKIMNLLTADFQRVADVASYLDNLYSLPMVLVVAVWYMYQLMGMAALLGLLISAAYVPLSKMLFQYMERLEDKLNAISDERVAAITEMLQGIKAVKLFGWESRF